LIGKSGDEVRLIGYSGRAQFFCAAKKKLRMLIAGYN
jgi:hypothetical protein